MSERDVAVERLGADYFQDPYTVHARLRAQRPVTPVIMPGGATVWLITGYAEARAALADPRMSKRVRLSTRSPAPSSPRWTCTCSTATRRITGRLRRLVSKAFTVRQVERLRPRITAITAALLDDMADQGDQRGLRDQPEVDLLARTRSRCRSRHLRAARRASPTGRASGLVERHHRGGRVRPAEVTGDGRRDDRYVAALIAANGRSPTTSCCRR